MNYPNIPDEMKVLKQWSCYKSYPDKETGKFKKVIISPVTYKFAKCNDPDTWTNFETAKAYCQRYGYKGLTFALTKGITFIDIDHARKPISGEISGEAQKLMCLLSGTFTESSVSGCGIHILLKGNLPENALKRNDSKGIEMYDKDRFICMTGECLNESRVLKDYSAEIAQINYDFIGKKPQPIFYGAAGPGTQSDSDLIDAILSSRQASKFRELYGGNISAYPSHSNADAAFVYMLAWWTSDPGQIDRIVRSSGLYRDKWDRRLGGGTYGSQLIDNALAFVIPRAVTCTEHSGQVKSFEM